MSSSYRIVDEPTPGTLTHLAVNPLFPLLSVMLVGIGFAWPWFLVNGLAIGSATRRRELLLVVAGFAGAALFSALLASAQMQSLVKPSLMPYLDLVGIAWALGISYAIHGMQFVSFQIYEYTGGSVRNGGIVLIMGMLLVRRLLPLLPGLSWLFW